MTADTAVSCATDAWGTIRAHVASAWPREACGLLIGHAVPGGWRIVRAAPAANRAQDPLTAFELDPAARTAWQRRLREAGGAEAVVGHYHSHPGGPPRPSTADHARAEEAGLIWLIVSSDAVGAGAATAFLAAAEATFQAVAFLPDAET